MGIRWRIIVIFVFLASQEVVSGQPDPCTSHTNIVEPMRSTGYVAQLPDYDHLICDNQLTKGWYRFHSNAGWEMPTSCPPMYHCGTHIPLWLNGSNPSAAAGIVTRDVCGNVPSGGCCGYKSTVRVKQCITASSMFYVYELQPTRGCSVAYCAGTRTPCPPNKWSPSGFEPGCKEIYPTMIQNPTLSLPIVKPFTFEFNCHVNFNSTRSDVGFDIEWLFDGLLDRHVTKRHISRLQRDSSIDQKYLVGHLGQAISCRVSSHFMSTPGRRGPGIVSKDYWMGIKFEPSSLHVGTNEHPKDVKLISTIPMVCDKPNAPSCGLELYLEPNNHVLRTTKSCTVHLGPKNWTAATHQAVVEFKVLAERNPLQKDHHLVLAFNKTKSWDAPPIFNNHHIPYLPIYTKDGPTGICSCVADPHCVTMDKNPANMNTAGDILKNFWALWTKQHGLFGNVYKLGEFVMYNSTKRPFEVQIRNWQCGKVTCICAVAAREGNDIIRVDMCHGSYGHTFPKVTIPNKNVTSHGTVIHKDSSGLKWVMEFPSGAVVTVTITAGRYMNVYVNAPEDDYNATQGLCGTFDGNYLNDQTGKDGTVYPWSSVPNAFVESWRVPVGSSFFDKPPAPDPKLDNNIYFCNCDTKKKPAVDCSLSNKAVRPAMHGLQVYNQQSQKPGQKGKKRSTVPGYSIDSDTEIKYYFDYGLFGGALTTARFPTARGITQYNATKMCIDALQNSPTVKECVSRTELPFEAEIRMCIEDIKLTDDLEFIHSAVETAIMTCQEHILKNASFYDANGQPPAFITSDLCPLQCSGHGTCVKGICQCDTGFTGDSCVIDSRKTPTLFNIIGSDMMNPTSDVCDIQRRLCHNIYVVGNNIRDHNALKCRLEEMEFKQGRFQPTGRTFETTLIYESVNNVLCSMPTQSQIQGKAVVGYNISLSNDGHSYSNKIQAYIIDTQCMNCNSNKGQCTIKPTTCLIDGKCRNGHEANPNDVSMICQPDTNQHQWTAKHAPSASPSPSPTAGLANTRLDLWTLSGTGCSCKSNDTNNNCACCDIDACQCPGPHQNQCANCNHMGNCGTLLQVGDNGLDGYTVSETDCTCFFDTTRGDCACCQNGGCQCDEPHHNQCVRCGSSGQCGAKRWLFGDSAMVGK